MSNRFLKNSFRSIVQIVLALFVIILLFSMILMSGCAGEQGGAPNAAYEKDLRDLKNNNILTRINAAKDLGKLGDEQAVEPLIQAFNDYYDQGKHDSEFPCAVVNALGEIGDERAVDVMATALNKEIHGPLRTSSATSLGKIGGAHATDVLIEDFRNSAWPDMDVYNALRNIGGNAVEPLISIIKDTSIFVDKRVMAVKLLGEIGDERAVDPLGELLIDFNLSGLAADELAQFGTPRAAELLIKGLDNKTFNIKCAQALTKFKSLTVLVETSRANDDMVRFTIAGMLSTNNDTVAINRLNEALDQGDVSIVGGAYKYYMHIGKTGSEEVLISALNKYGSRDMAQDYLNCGNKQLKKAAEDWAFNHLVPIETGTGVSSLTWGR